MSDLYQPPRKYRPRFFTPVGWMLVIASSIAAVIWAIFMVWILYAIFH